MNVVQPAKSSIAAAAVWLLALPIFAGETNRIQTLDNLEQNIASFISQPRFSGALWGVKIISLDTGRTLFESNADRLMSPASNCKLYTGALALDRFGGDYQPQRRDARACFSLVARHAQTVQCC